MDEKLSSIIDKYWNDFVSHRNKEFVVNPSIPIIWFGDMEAYLNSSFKVVTVAINPSDVEFNPTKKEIKAGKESHFLRFSKAESIYNRDYLDSNSKEILFDTLNNYFKDTPYTKWFNWFERSLLLFKNKVSYYPNIAPNNAVHIDIYSALATTPTWGKLTQQNKNVITNIDLFKELLHYLNPDVVIFSGNYDVFKKTFNPEGASPLAEYNYKAENAKYAYKIMPYHLNNKLIIFGSNVQGNPLQLKEEFIKNAFDEILKNYL